MSAFIKNWRSIIPDFFYQGSTYYCNICGFKANAFLPRGHKNSVINELKIVGAGYRFANCKKCGSSDRDRLVYAYFEYLAQFENVSSQSLLHIAPDKSLSRNLSQKLGIQVVRLDAKMKGYQFDYGSRVVSGDLTCLSFENDSFDWLLANHVLEYICDEEAAISEIIRVLKPNGRAILQVPYSPLLQHTIESEQHWSPRKKEQELGQHDALRLYGLDLPQRFMRKNFMHQPPDHNFMVEPQKLKLFPNEYINLFRKIGKDD